ncbi:MAG: hypothetical protein AAGF12_32445 [Myxococcota bacterium]
MRRGNGNEVRVGRPYNNLLVSILGAFGLGETDYQTPGDRGFGEYSDGMRNFEDYYRPLLTAAERTKPLPHLFL